MKREPLNIVILGGSFAGLSVAHHFLDHVLSSLSTFEDAPTYRVVLVSPSTHIYWNICAPRALVSAELIPTETAFREIVPGFSRYPFHVFTFMQGAATRIDTSARTVTVVLASENISKRYSALSGSTTRNDSAVPTSPTGPTTDYRPTGASRASIVQTIPYHALILATGSSSNSPLYSLHGAHEQTIAEIRQFHARLHNAQSILVVGGGPSGVETAGQLASYYNWSPRWPLKPMKTQKAQPTKSRSFKKRLDLLSCFRKPKLESPATSPTTPSINITPPNPFSKATKLRRPKTITILSGSDRLLPKLAPNVGRKAAKQLTRLGVHVVHSIRQVGATTNADGSTNCILNNDMTITADVLIEATGVYPNTSYLPPEMLDESGYVLTDPEDLRIYGPDIGDRVYAIGDCASYSKNYVLDVYEAVPVLMQNLKNDLLTHEVRLEAQVSRSEPPMTPHFIARRLAELEDAKYVQNPTDSQLMPISRYGGVGVIFDIRLPSLMVHLMKGRDYKLGKAGAVVGKGRNPYGMK